MADFIQVTDSGLNIATRQQIYESLTEFAKAAYGNDISLDEGTPFDMFLQMLADCLSTVNGSVQSFSELFSTKELSGNFLDFIAGQRGVIRKVKRNQRVAMLVTVDSSVSRPFIAARNSIFINDSKGRTWVNTTQLQIQAYKLDLNGVQNPVLPNFQGTCEFGLTPLDGYDTDLLYSNNDNTFLPFTVNEKSDPIFNTGFTFENKVNATPAVLSTETDAQFRARYDNAVYSNAVATVEGLRSNLLKLTDYVRIVENMTNEDIVTEENPYGLSGHSIWCIVGGGSKSDTYDGTPSGVVSTDSSDIAIAQTILNYKSLGCGVSVDNNVVGGTVEIEGETLNTGNFMVEIPIETMIAQVPFTRLVENKVDFNISLSANTSDGNLRNTVRDLVSLAMQEYVATLQPGDVITTVDAVNAIYGVLSNYDNGLFDFVSIQVNYAIGAKIEIYQKAIGGVAVVQFVD